MSDQGTNEKRHMWRLAGKYSSFGIELAFCIVVPTVAGNWVDEKYATSPYGFYVGVVVGLGAVVQLIRRLIHYTKKHNL